MDHDLCKWALSGMATGIGALAFAFWRVLAWWKKESEDRLRDSQLLSKIVGGGDETRVK